MVLPLPVPPDITALIFDLDIALIKVAISVVILPSFNKSCTISGLTENRRIETTGPSNASGGIMAFTREPSAKRASTIGLDSSMRRPTLETMRSIIFNR